MAHEKQLQDLPPSYSNIGFDDEPVAGPSTPKNYEEEVSKDGLRGHSPSAPFLEVVSGPTPLVYNPPSLVFEEIYEACVKYVKRHFCYGSRFVRQMKLTEIVNKGVFHYILESFGEKRESAWHSSPYKGGFIDGPENGPPPDPWDIHVSPTQLFKDGKTQMEIPHTASVSTCTRCRGDGLVTCTSCGGDGTVSCWSCSGTGTDSEDNTCSSCSGSGYNSCSWCCGSGEVTCSKCDGYGKIKDCRMLLVTWKNHLTDYITDAGCLTEKLIQKADGIVMLREEAQALHPVTNAPDQKVNDASARLLRIHQTSYRSEMIIKQRHVLRAIPWTKVTYQWKEREGEFYVYDTDRKVFFEDYPQPCCCCTCC